MDELIAFITARIREDEAGAKAAPGGNWQAFTEDDVAGASVYDEQWALLYPMRYDHDDPMSIKPGATGPQYIQRSRDGLCAHIARHDPDRARREVAAKRGRLALLVEATAEMDRLLADDTAGRVEQAMAIGRARAAAVAVKHDAAVWSDHPDYPLSGSRDAPEVPSGEANRTLSQLNTPRDQLIGN